MREGTNVRANGTIDGEPAYIEYNAAQKQTHIYWGGPGRYPMGPGHNHATVRDASPNEFHFMRSSGRIVVNQGFNPKNPRSARRRRDSDAAVNIAAICRKALRDAIRWNTMGFRK